MPTVDKINVTTHQLRL